MMTIADDKPASDLRPPRELAKDDFGRSPAGIGGFMLLVFLYLAAIVALSAAAVFFLTPTVLAAWPNLPAYGKAGIGACGIVVALSAILAPIWLISLALRRREIFPGLFIIWGWALPLVVAAVTLGLMFIFTGQLAYMPAIGAGLLFLILGLTGISYLNHSARVENTFNR